MIEVAPEISDGRHRADRGAGRRGPHQDRHGAARPPGRQVLGRGRQDGLDGRLDGAAGRRPRLARAQGRPDGRGVRPGALRGRGRHADGRHRRRGRHLPHRPRDRDRARVRRTRPTPTASSTTASTSPSTARSCAATSIRQKLEDKVVADATKAGPQREVSQIYLTKETVDLPDEAVKVRHILYSPKDDPAAAAQGGDDPGRRPLVGAGQERRRRPRTPSSRPTPRQFDAIARAESDEESARGADRQRRRAGRLRQRRQQLRPDVLGADPRGQADRRPAPRRRSRPSSAGTSSRSSATRRTWPRSRPQADGGADFAKLARTSRTAQEASRGGDLGWIARGQLDAAKIGRRSSRRRSARPRTSSRSPTTASTCSRSRGGGADAGRPPARGDPLPRLLRLVRAQEGRGRDRARPGDSRTAAG